MTIVQWYNCLKQPHLCVYTISTQLYHNVHSFIYSFICSYIHSFICSFVCSFIYSPIRPFVCSSARSFTCSLIHSPSFDHSCIRQSFRLSVRSLARSRVHSFIHLVLFVNASHPYIHSSTHRLIRFIVYSLVLYSLNRTFIICSLVMYSCINIYVSNNYG